MLLEKGTDCNKCDEDGWSPLINACKHGHTEIVLALLEKGADCNKCDVVGHSPLINACKHKHGHTEIVKLLIDKGTDCNKYDWTQQSPLFYACTHGHAEIVQILLVDNRYDLNGQSHLINACIKLLYKNSIVVVRQSGRL
ncbi:ankyrin repeat family A protein 2-like [Mytilus edulis]|uniref:ankyrin repeat family A protein 2-like n=1 Tax=Mytilus edulis TaxID=6550 RepID=UPI0039EE013F